MKVYLVGGAVRDLVMGLPVKDEDYVVVGSTVEEMLFLDIKKEGELNHLVSERLWSELTKVFKENTYYEFFNILSDLDVLQNLFPEVYDQRYLLIPLSINNLPEKYQFCLLASIFYTYEDKFISFCERLKAPKEYEKLGHFVLSHFDDLIDYTNLDPINRFALYEKSGLLKQNTLMFDALDFIHYYKMINDKNLIENTKLITSKEIVKIIKGI